MTTKRMRRPRNPANGNLIDQATVISDLPQACLGLSESELAEAAAVFGEIASRI